MSIRVGISGWQYDDWRGAFYPSGLARRNELAWASRRLDSIELNGTFYSLKKPDHYRAWAAAAPSGFKFSVKGSRFITHNKRLRGVESALANFFASGPTELGEKLGPILWQLPPTFRYDEDRVAAFLDLLPRDTDAALRLAGRHDERVASRPPGRPRRRHRIRYVIEPRHESFFVPEFIRLLRRRGVALAFSKAPTWPYREEITAGFIYIRLHGPQTTYAGSYSSRELRAWAERVRIWSRGGEPPDAHRVTERAPPRRKRRDVYLYFDNDQKAFAPANAMELLRRL